MSDMVITSRNKQIYGRVSELSSLLVTHKYSTSFSIGIRLLRRDIRNAVYAIYGFVRLGDEIVDTFVDHDREELLRQFKLETQQAVARKISLNPVLHNFQRIVHRYEIEQCMIEAFFDSMEMDLQLQRHQRPSYESYVYGSAEVVGLMCLKIFCNGDSELYRELKPYAESLGAAFQKVNFLRDYDQDTKELNRFYFPHGRNGELGHFEKHLIEKEIEEDFNTAITGILKLPSGARLGVYVAYIYYRYLLEKLKMVSPEKLKSTRIRVSNKRKLYLLFKSVVKYKLNLI